MLTKKRLGGFWYALAPFFALAAVGAAFHLSIAKKTTVISAAYYGEFSERLGVALQIPFFYLGKFFLPTGISPFYAENFETSLLAPRTLLSALFLAGIALLLWLLRKKYPELLLGSGWFAITLLPVSNLFATSPVAADRYLFLPSFGLAFALVSMAGRITLPSPVKVSIAALILALLATVTFRQNRIWHDEISLWSETARRSPQVAGVWFNLGRALQKTPQLSFALEAYLRAIKLDPADIKPLDNAAALFPATRGSIRERHDLVMSLAEQMPDYPAGLEQIGNVQREWRYPDAAEELFFYLLAADPNSKHLRLAMANFYRKMGANDRAEAILRQ
jgi:tetratricopeptide (TPR) repeat protein